MNSKTKITLILILIVVAIIAFMLVLPVNKVEAPIASNEEKPAPTYESISHVFEKDDLETNSVSIHITKPKIAGLSSRAINDAVNAQINSDFAQIKNSFLEETKNSEVFSNEMKHQLTVEGSEPFSASAKTFYIEVKIYSYYSGAAHPLSQTIVYNFVKETGQLIRLEDILKKDDKAKANNSSDAAASEPNDADYKSALTALSDLAKPKIVAELNRMVDENKGEGSGANSFEESGAAPSFANYGVFYIHEDRIDWVFGQYQVAPYVFGEIAISIPMSQLRPYLVDRTYLK